MQWKSRFKIINKNDSSAQANEQAQTEFYKTLTNNYNTDFGAFEGAQSHLQSLLNPIINAGPGQYGFDATEDSAIRGAAIDSDAAAAQSAQQAVQRQITAANGGADLMPTGAADELREQGEVAAAHKLSSDMNTVTQAGYQQGATNYQNALSAETGLVGMMNPSGFASAATSGGNAATGAVDAATQAEQASYGWENALGGLAGGVAGALTKKFTS